MRHRHYSPRARVVVAQDRDLKIAPGAAYIGLRKPPIGAGFSLRCRDVGEYAHSLFEFLREADRQGVDTIYCEAVKPDGIGRALMDRIRRAALAE
jgi:L-threonylcarbamoyladenylate synthase